MPTNLPQEYYDADERYRAATSTDEKITTLEELISTIPKHKGTDKLRADLRKRLSKLKNAAQSGGKGTGKQGSPYHIDKEGAGQVVVIGPANVGKSSLITALTNAEPEIADYPYTTRKPLPGMMSIENIQVQLIDTPPLSKDSVDPQLMDLIRRANLILLVIDLQADPITQLEESLALLQEHRIIPQHLKDRFPEQKRLVFKPLLVLVNKADDAQADGDYEALCELLGTQEQCPLLPISAVTERKFDSFKQEVFQYLEIIRVYSKPPGKEPDYTVPFVLKKGDTVEDFAIQVHKDFARSLKSARVWGSSTYDGQMVSREHQLHDNDVVELRI